jgi:hypothetical protein
MNHTWGTTMRLTAALALALAAAGCLSTGAVAGDGAAEPLGLFEASFDGRQTVRLVPTRCDSGDPQLFLGVDLASEEVRAVVRLVVDPLVGPVARLFDADHPFERTAVFQRADCRRFELSLEETGWTINDVRVRKIELDLDCTLPEGARLSGRATAGHCS